MVVRGKGMMGERQPGREDSLRGAQRGGNKMHCHPHVQVWVAAHRENGPGRDTGQEELGQPQHLLEETWRVRDALANGH